MNAFVVNYPWTKIDLFKKLNNDLIKYNTHLKNNSNSITIRRLLKKCKQEIKGMGLVKCDLCKNVFYF